MRGMTERSPPSEGAQERHSLIAAPIFFAGLGLFFCIFFEEVTGVNFFDTKLLKYMIK
jgi:hypothetical protein